MTTINSIAKFLQDSLRLEVSECRCVWRTRYEAAYVMNQKLVDCKRWKERAVQWHMVKQQWIRKEWH
jgi:hypothetical protein